MGCRIAQATPEVALSFLETAMLTTLRAYLAQHLATVDASLHTHLQAFVDYIEGEEAKVAAEVQHLTSLGYTVTKAAEAVAAVSQA
jgi:Holliday junction resolvasome RuvABC DNA-binding subunit